MAQGERYHHRPSEEVFQQTLDSLDVLPKITRQGKVREDNRKCLYRKIDDQWFLFAYPIAFNYILGQP